MKCPKCGHETKRRSNDANRYYWGVVIPSVMEFTGYTEDEAHDAMKVKFLGQEDMRLGLVHVRSSAACDTREFFEYVEKIRQWMLEFFGHRIPEPNEAV